MSDPTNESIPGAPSPLPPPRLSSPWVLGLLALGLLATGTWAGLQDRGPGAWLGVYLLGAALLGFEGGRSRGFWRAHAQFEELSAGYRGMLADANRRMREAWKIANGAPVSTLDPTRPAAPHPTDSEGK